MPLYKFVDDSTIFEICNTNEVSVIQESIDVAVEWTVNNDMEINPEKSKEMIICFSKNVNFRNNVPNVVVEGILVEQVDHAKLLGITLSNDLTWNKHVDNIVKTAAKRVYMIYHLKRSGISQTDLVKVYMCIVRPVLEYACPVWHTNLPIYLSDDIEMVQKRVLKSIFPGQCYNDILNHTGISSLKERRDHLCRKYFNDMKVNSHKLNHLLPDKRQVEYDLRPVNAYPLPQTRTDRYRNSIIPWGLFHWQ